MKKKLESWTIAAGLQKGLACRWREIDAKFENIFRYENLQIKVHFRSIILFFITYNQLHMKMSEGWIKLADGRLLFTSVTKQIQFVLILIA